MLVLLSLNEKPCTNPNNAQSDFGLSDRKMGFTKDDSGTIYISFEYSGDNQTNTSIRKR